MGLKIDVSGLRFRKSDGNLSRADQARIIQRRLSNDLNRSLLSKVRSGDDISCESIFTALRKPENIDVKEILPAVSASQDPELSSQVIFPQMVLVKGGTFLMGSEKTPQSNPPQKVTIPDFYCGVNMVLKKEYMSFLAAKEMDVPARLSQVLADDLPAIDMSCIDAKAFCSEWLNKSGENYRIVSNTEWEYVMKKQAALIKPTPENICEWTEDLISVSYKTVRCRSLIDMPDGCYCVGQLGHAPNRGFRVAMDSPKT